MYTGKLVFSQVIEHLPMHTFRRCVRRYDGHHKVHSFTCLDQYLCMAFAQLTYRESLRDIEACLRSQSHKLYHMGLRGTVSRNTLANANATRDWRIYADFAQRLIATARRLYADEPLAVDLANTVYALDATTIDLCLSVFPWAQFVQTKGAVRLHTLLDLRGNIPSFIHITDGRVHDVRALDQLVAEPGALYVMDRGYVDFSRLYRLHQARAFFVIRARDNLQFRRRYSHRVDGHPEIICDQTIVLTGAHTPRYYPEALRRIKVRDPERARTLVLLTNHPNLSAGDSARLYRSRWQIELFFKWIKQHLRIKAFFGTSENAVKTQIWIAVSVYVLIAIIRKRLGLSSSLYNILQVLSVTAFEKTPLDQLLTNSADFENPGEEYNQLNLL